MFLLCVSVVLLLIVLLLVSITEASSSTTRRVLIIGGGINAASTAFFLCAIHQDEKIQQEKLLARCCNKNKKIEKSQQQQQHLHLLRDIRRYWYHRLGPTTSSGKSSTDFEDHLNKIRDYSSQLSCSDVDCAALEENFENSTLEIIVAEKDEKHVGGRVLNVRLSELMMMNKAKSKSKTTTTDQQHQINDEDDIVEIGASVGHNANILFSYFAEQLMPRILNKSASSSKQKDDGKKKIAQKKKPADESQHKQRHDDSVKNFRTHPYKNSKLGVWNGHEFAFQELSDNEPLAWIRTAISAFWRYGMEPLWIRRHCLNPLVAKLIKVYQRQLFFNQDLRNNTFESAEGLLDSLKLFDPIVFENIPKYFERCAGAKASSKFVNEVSHALGRLNYGQFVESLSALAGGVAMLGSGDSVFAIRGGNRRMIESVFEAAGAKILLGTTVQIVADDDKNKKKLLVSSKTSTTKEETKLLDSATNFDAIIVAHPKWTRKADKTDKQTLNGHITHVTIARATFKSPFEDDDSDDKNNMMNSRSKRKITSTRSCWNVSAFGYKSQIDMPTIVGTARPEKSKSHLHKVFYRSIGMLRAANSNNNNKATKTNNEHHHQHSSCIFKIFSDEKVSVEQLETVLTPPVDILYEHEWDAAYPKLDAANKKANDEDDAKTKFILYENVDQQNTNPRVIVNAGALEKYVSTLETQSISGANAAFLTSRYLLQQKQQQQKQGEKLSNKKQHEEKSPSSSSSEEVEMVGMD